MSWHAVMNALRTRGAIALCLSLSAAACQGSGAIQSAAPPSEGTPSSTGPSVEGRLASPIASTPSAAASGPLALLDNEEWIAYQWDCVGREGICLVRPDGTGTHELLDGLTGSATHPDWSPDGTRIAFIRIIPDDRTELWVADADGTDPERLVSCDVPCNTLSYPDWAPDGSAVYFGKDANASAEHPPLTFTVDRVDIASRVTTTVLSREDGWSAEQPRLSPDGTEVVYARFRDLPTPGSAIFRAPVAGGDERQLTDWGLFGAHPDWSKSDRIVFNTYDLGVFPDTTEPANLYTVAVDGSDLRQLTSFGNGDTRGTQPRWTPDGTGIVFTRVDGPGWGERRLAYVDADGTGLRWLTPSPIAGTHPQLRPVPSPR
jgi:Tol biopolymer transport system component